MTMRLQSAVPVVGRGADPSVGDGSQYPTSNMKSSISKGTSARRGRRVSIFGAGTPPCRWSPILATAILLLLGLASSAVEPDQIFLRDGRTLSGNIVGETPDIYRTLIPTASSPLLTNVSVKTVRYVVYGSPIKARTALRLDETARTLGANDPAKIRFLPAEAFGEAIAEAATTAQSRIWILAYYISGGSHPSIQRFYETLRAKGRTGVDIRVISEFGNATPMPVRNATMNFVQTLQADGIQIRFIQQYSVMHKKMLLVDRNRVLLGSSNLTGAGVDISDEFNVLIESEPFARKAEADFRQIEQQSEPFEKLKY